MYVVLSIFRSASDETAVFALLALGLILSFRVIRFPDLTVDGSFLVGAAAYAKVLHHPFQPAAPWIALAAAFISGAIAGLATGLLSERLRINQFLAGIIVMTASYSVALRIMGQANLPLMQTSSLFTAIDKTQHSDAWNAVVFSVIALIAVVCVGLLLWTEIGLQLRAVGENHELMKSLGRRTDILVISGLMLSNGLVGLAGGLLAQKAAAADIAIGSGMLVSGLACMYIGDTATLYIGLPALLRRPINALMAAAVLGSFAYCAMRAGARELNINQMDLKGATAVLVVIALVLGRRKRQSALVGDEVL